MRSLKRPSGVFRLPLEDQLYKKNGKKAIEGKVRDWHNVDDVWKSKLRADCMERQKGRCAYCDLEIGDAARRNPTLDHFVPKGQKFGYPKKWCFDIYNLILSCATCNQNLKSQHDPVEKYSSNTKRYRRSYYNRNLHFNICHPYFDNIRKHIDGGFFFNSFPKVPEGLTDKGRNTIKLFNLNDPNYYEELIKDYVFIKASEKTLTSNQESLIDRVLAELG